MFTTMQVHAESRTVHRILWGLAVIVFLAMLLVPRAGATELREPMPPEPLSLTASQATARPLTHATVTPTPAQIVPDAYFEADELRLSAELPTALWLAMEAQRAGDFAEADMFWSYIDLPHGDQVWREAARAMCSLMQGDAPLADARLAAAGSLAQGNAVFHYVRAVVNVAMAERAGQWADAIGPSPIRLVRYRAETVPHHPRSTYLLRASHHFRAAIELAVELVPDAPLIASYPPVATTAGLALNDRDGTVVPARVPTVREYLVAIGCADFVARSHLGLAQMSLEAETLAEAEKHLEAATRLGLDVQDTWLTLGAAYEHHGEWDSATRVYLRAIGNGPAVATPVRRALRSMRDMFR